MGRALHWSLLVFGESGETPLLRRAGRKPWATEALLGRAVCPDMHPMMAMGCESKAQAPVRRRLGAARLGRVRPAGCPRPDRVSLAGSSSSKKVVAIQAAWTAGCRADAGARQTNAAGIATLFFGVVRYSRIVGHWQSDIPAATYQQLVPRANQAAHPMP
jgi:hypothetical protein